MQNNEVSQSSSENGERSNIRPSAAAHTPDFVLDVRHILTELAKKSWIVLLFAAAGLFMGVKEAHDFVPKYRATIIISPRSESPSFANAPAAGITGLSSVVNLLSGQSSSDGSGLLGRFRLLVQSTQLAKILDDKHNTMRVVFANQWDEEKGAWQELSIDNSYRTQIDKYLNVHGHLPVGFEALAAYIGGLIKFENIKDTTFWELTVEHVESDRALELLTQIYWSGDELLRKQDEKELRKKIEYLQSRIAATPLIDLRVALTNALASAEQQVHMMSGGLPYIADIVDPPFVSDMKTKPFLLKVVGVPTAVATAIGIFFLLLFVVFRAESQ